MELVTREEWLVRAGVELSDLIHDATRATVPQYHVSVGFPKGGSGRHRAIGQCWSGVQSADGKAHLFVCPTLGDAVKVLDVLLHEIIHATVGTKHGHKGEFVTMAKACGLVKPWTATTPCEDLKARLNTLAEKLGPYPHAVLVPGEKVKKGSRLRLWECECGVKVRVASDDFRATCGLCEGEFERKG